MLCESAELLRQMIAIPSPSFGEEGVSDALSVFLQDKGIEHKRLNNNIIALNKHYNPANKTLMLCAHLDTVPPADGYDFDPYSPDYDAVAKTFSKCEVGAEEIIAGLGANDDGASVVSLIAVFRHFYEQELPLNLMLVLSTEEERSGPGGMIAVWKALESSTLTIPHSIGTCDCKCNKNNVNPTSEIPLSTPNYAIVGEPTEMKAAKAERGLLVIDAVAQGVSGHAARDEGVNAIYIALRDIDKLTKWDFDKVSPLMGKVKLTVTQINAGATHNVVPDKCTFVVDIRPTEQYTNEEIVQTLQAECESRLTPRNMSNRSSVTREESPLLKTAAALGTQTYVSPTTSDWMRISCDAIKMGPGSSSRSHRKNEYVTLAELRDGIGKYIEFIDTFIKQTEYGDTME